MRFLLAREDCYLKSVATKKDFKRPVILTCYDPSAPSHPLYGSKECFVHVYGLRHTVHLMINEDCPRLMHLAHHRRKVLTVLTEGGLHNVVDMKLVFKRPYKSACLGPKLFLKLYLSQKGNFDSLRSVMKTITMEGLEKLDRTTVHDHALSPETRWMNNKRAHTVGHVFLPEGNSVLREGKHYNEIHVHHSQVVFDNGERVPFFPSPPSGKDHAVSFAERAHLFVNEHVTPLFQKGVSGPTCLHLDKYLRDIESKLSLELEMDEGNWTWPRFKKTLLKPFLWLMSSPKDEKLASQVKQHGYLNETNLVEGISLQQAMGHVFFQLLKKAYELKAVLKTLWRDLVERQPNHADVMASVDMATRKISSEKRWLAFDIETDHKPHEVKEETITVISTILWTHADDHAKEFKVFFRMPPGEVGRDFESACAPVTEAGIRKVLKETVKEPEKLMRDFPALFDCTTENLQVCFFKTEKELLEGFACYVHQTRSSAVAYYNGHKFDMPFLCNRWAVNNTSGQKAKDKLVLESGKSKERYFKFSFSHRKDCGYVKFKPPNAKHTHRAFGIRHYAEAVITSRKQSAAGERTLKAYLTTDTEKDCDGDDGDDDYDDDDDDNDDTDDDDNDYGYEAGGQDGQARVLKRDTDRQAQKKDGVTYQGFLQNARKVDTVLMSHTCLVDVMLFVADKNRGCKLDTAAKKYLGYGKVDDEAVAYDNLCETWIKGDRVKLAAYCLVDTIVLERIVRTLQLNGFHLAMGETIGLPERELLLGDSIRRLISNAHRLGYCENLLTPDTGLIRDDRYLWIPGHKFDAGKDYKNLRPPAGSTVPDVFGMYMTPCVTLDFKAQYPSIMAAYNYCLTSLIEEDDVKKHGLVENVDYRKIVLENVRPILEHACTPLQKRLCGMECHADDPSKCSFTQSAERVTYDAYFVTESFYKSILNRSSCKMGEARSMYKQLRDKAKKSGNVILAMVHELNQLAVKTVNNSTYGGTMRFNGIVGDAITNRGRQQARDLAQMAEGKGLAVVNGDTDSVFVQLIPNPSHCENLSTMAKYHGMATPVTIDDLVSKWFQLSLDFAHEANHGVVGVKDPLYPKPCFLEFEKIFVSIRNYAKKCYSGTKLNPDHSVQYHRSGMTGKKADTTVVKTASQFISDKLCGRKDFLGWLQFVEDIYRLASKEIERTESLERKVQEYSAEIDDTDMMNQRAESAREKIRNVRQMFARQKPFVPPEWVTGTERVGDVYNPKNLATKKAIRECKIKGEERFQAPMVIPMCRSAEVQLVSGLKKVLDVFLAGPESEEDVKVRNRREQRELENMYALGLLKRPTIKQTKDAGHKVTKLDVTAMPEKWRVKKEARYYPTPPERQKALQLRRCIDVTTTQKRAPLPNSAVLKMFDPPMSQKEIETRLKRLKLYVEHMHRCEPFVPPHLIPPDTFTVSQKEGCKVVSFNPRTGCDLWTVYTKVYATDRFMLVTRISEDLATITAMSVSDSENGDNSATTYKPTARSWDLGNALIFKQGISVLLDMALYRKQTTSTPVVTPGWKKGADYLVNRDSYIEPTEDYLYFKVTALSICELLDTLNRVGTETVTISAVPGATKVAVSTGQKIFFLPIVSILRSDGRDTDKWLWMASSPPMRFRILDDTVRTLTSSMDVNRGRQNIILRFVCCQKQLRVTDDVFYHSIVIDLCQQTYKMEGPLLGKRCSLSHVQATIPRKLRKTDRFQPSVSDFFPWKCKDKKNQQQ